jgi:type IV secretion system protein VirB1
LTVLITTAMLSLLRTCTPNVGPVTMAAIVQHESGWNAYAIGDNTTRRSYYPKSQSEAAALATSLLAQGHNIDAGIAQINSDNWREYGLNALSVFDACTNLSVGGKIIWGDYWGAAHVFGPGQLALWHALQAYNSGNYYAAYGYAKAVWATGMHIAFSLPTSVQAATSRKQRIPIQAVPYRPAETNRQTTSLLVTREADRWSTKQ